jgi:hypothetical protein
MAEMLITSPDPKLRHLHDYEFRSSTGHLLTGATLCFEEGDAIVFEDDCVKLVVAPRPATLMSLATPKHELTVFRPHIAAIRHIEFDQTPATVEQQAEIKRIIEEQYAKKLNLRPDELT